MRYIPHTDEEIRCMLRRAGCSSLDELFQCIPPPLRRAGALNLPEAGSEQEVLARLEALAARNENAAAMDCFLGAGCYAHFLPSAVDALVSRAEFTTSYTPYQAEISQGTLQAVFEWQTMLCGLTGLEVANASLYDGASATAEAALMALRITRRRKVVASAGLHPHTLQVLRTYLRALGAELRVLPAAADGRTAAPADLCDDTACLVVQQPGFLGVVEEIAPLAQAAHAAGALCIATHSEALALALLRAPGALGADIACGEAQSFGVPMSFGGPHLGFLAARREFLRQMPGRLVGQTEDSTGKRGFVLTLATREQHIRRERATSNVCTNQGLCLLMATIYLSLLGRRGLAELARLNLAKAEFAKSLVRRTPGLSLPLSAPTFNEFAVGVPDAAAALARARDAGCIGGLDLAPFAPQLGPALLICTTELCSRAAIERLVAALAGVQ
ncbi:MAG: aminomethyl-transferring glycine dehydrogenase subunit GcvPA [Deltaproteobacteria bacterium]|nr:aminomethyl-transferring glycine dehydrogenase subunit GcvPA [Deltaproteobacteria bacterium]